MTEQISLVRPLGDRIVAVRQETPQQSSGGILLPASAQEQSCIAEVIAIGTDFVGAVIGDRVLYKEYGVTEVSLQGTQYLIINQADVLAVIG